MNRQLCLALMCTPLILAPAAAEPPPRTTLSILRSAYRPLDAPYHVLTRGPLRAVIVSNREVDDEVLPGHRGGYSGVARLTHDKQPRNIFVPAYAGLNFEHIHDGTTQPRDILFEPRRAPMELRYIDEHTVELYQPPTPHWGLESCQRFRLLEDGAVELTVEFIPRRATFAHRTIGLFWASYIHQPESLDIHFRGRAAAETDAPDGWIRGVTPSHGVEATHLGVDDSRSIPHDEDFPLSLVFNRSKFRFTEPWYYGVSHGMALAYLFRPQDQVRLTQSPSGGGRGNPAWDFQYFITDCEVDRRYQIVMRALYVPFASAEQLHQLVQPHLAALRN